MIAQNKKLFFIKSIYNKKLQTHMSEELSTA